MGCRLQTFSGGEQPAGEFGPGDSHGRHPILLLDEPTASLDAANRDVVIRRDPGRRRRTAPPSSASSTMPRCARRWRTGCSTWNDWGSPLPPASGRGFRLRCGGRGLLRRGRLPLRPSFRLGWAWQVRATSPLLLAPNSIAVAISAMSVPASGPMMWAPRISVRRLIRQDLHEPIRRAHGAGAGRWR